MPGAINPNVIAQLHDRGAEMTPKMWLSTNADVEESGGRIRLDPDHTTGTYMLNYLDAASVADAVDACLNFSMALQAVRPEDRTGTALLATLTQVGMFAHEMVSPNAQKDLIMELFGQVGTENDP
jgi:hypothetical protein